MRRPWDARGVGSCRRQRTVECNRDFFNSGFAFATARSGAQPVRDPATPPVRFDLSARCVNHELSDEQLAQRRRLIDTVTLYADALHALTTPDKSLGDSARALADEIKALADARGFPEQEKSSALKLETAVVLITQMVLERRSRRSVSEAAVAMQEPLGVVIDHLKAENLNDALGLSSKAALLTAEIRSGLVAARDKRGAASFLEVIFARQALQSLIISPPDVAELNSTLDAVVTANAALAHAKGGGAIPAIAELRSRAERAAALFNSLK